MGSGPNNHVTSDLNNLSLKNDYKGKGKLIIVNGQKLSISHIGATIIDSNEQSKPLHLNNILHIHRISENVSCVIGSLLQ